MEKLTLIVPYRDRKVHLKTQLLWWQQQTATDLFNCCEILLIELTATPSTWIQAALTGSNVRYLHLPCTGAFHKTKALNFGLSIATGNWIVPFDVDLIPVGTTLLHHWQIAQSARSLLITGYRLMHSAPTLEINQIDAAIAKATIAPEDMPTALYKHLTRGERFGVVPFFQRSVLEQIGGWDEQFIGWGGEDQDLIERYMSTNYTLCRCPELVYLHLHHPPQPQWNDPELTQRNRQHYYAKLQSQPL